MVNLRSEREIAAMRRAGLVVWGAHQLALSLVRPGVTTGEMDRAIEQFFLDHSAVPLFKGVPGKVPFPAVCCMSVNEEVVHGIPSDRVLLAGDIVSIDTGCSVGGGAEILQLHIPWATSIRMCSDSSTAHRACWLWRLS